MNTRRVGEPPTEPAPDQPLTRLILDSIGDGVFTVDDHWRITSFNAAAERITGVGRERAVGMKCHDVFKADICQGNCALRRTLDTGRPCRNAHVTVLNAAMEEVPVTVSTAVLKDDAGQVVGGVEIMRDNSDVEALRRELQGRTVFHDIVGVSPPMQEVFRILPDVARSDVPVLIQGPSGTGKELVARAIMSLSERSNQPFLQINCGALPDSLLESELFGFKRGAFTDARRDNPGLFVAADGGTLLLDEIGDTSPAFQVKLLRALQEGEVQPLGSPVPRRVDVRVISATNRDLAAMVRAGEFREDLFYRLRVVTIDLPPLKERHSDIPLLVDHLLRRVVGRRGGTVRGLTPDAMDKLCAYDYPGNVRELENIIERALVLCHRPFIDVVHLPREVVDPPTRSEPMSAPDAVSEVPTRHDLSPGERLAIALRDNRWNRQDAADALGVSRSTLWRRMKKYGLIP